MALQKSMEISGVKLISGSGFVYQLGEETVTTEPLYIKVTSITGDKERIRASVSFANGQEGVQVMSRDYSFSFDLNGPNIIEQTYEYLKTLPEFSDAVDC